MRIRDLPCDKRALRAANWFEKRGFPSIARILRKAVDVHGDGNPGAYASDEVEAEYSTRYLLRVVKHSAQVGPLWLLEDVIACAPWEIRNLMHPLLYRHARDKLFRILALPRSADSWHRLLEVLAWEGNLIDARRLERLVKNYDHRYATDLREVANDIRYRLSAD